MPLDGKRALVTGAGRGLGAAMACGLADAGARVALVARNAEQLATVAQSIGARAVSVPADVSDPRTFPLLVDQVEKALEGPIDIVVHAAGIQHRQRAVEFALDDWQQVLGVNLTSPFFLSQEIGRRQLADARKGSHIFVGSLTSRLSVSGVIAYTASKSGVYGVIRNLSLEWSAQGIRVNGIGPGYVETELTRAIMEDAEKRRRLLDRIPMGRFGQPEDMAGAAVFLASDASAYVTGQLLMVDGGWSAS